MSDNDDINDTVPKERNSIELSDVTIDVPPPKDSDDDRNTDGDLTDDDSSSTDGGVVIISDDEQLDIARRSSDAETAVTDIQTPRVERRTDPVPANALTKAIIYTSPLFIVLIGFFGLLIGAYLLGPICFLCFLPMPLWLYLFYWRKNRVDANINDVVTLAVFGFLGFIPLTIGQLSVVWGILLLNNIFKFLGSLPAAIIASFVDSFLIKALPEQLYVLILLLVFQARIDTHFCGTCYGLAAGLGIGTVTIILKSMLGVIFHSFCKELIKKKHHCPGVWYPFAVWAEESLLTLSMHAITGMWIGLGIARNKYLSESQAKKKHRKTFSLIKVMLPVVLIHGLFEWFPSFLDTFQKDDSIASFGMSDYTSYLTFISIGVCLAILSSFLVYTLWSLWRKVYNPSYYSPFQDIIDDDDENMKTEFE